MEQHKKRLSEALELYDSACVITKMLDKLVGIRRAILVTPNSLEYKKIDDGWTNVTTSVTLALNLECIVWKELGETSKFKSGKDALQHVWQIRDTHGLLGFWHPFVPHKTAWSLISKCAKEDSKRANILAKTSPSLKLTLEWEIAATTWKEVAKLIDGDNEFDKIQQIRTKAIAKWEKAELMGWIYRMGVANHHVAKAREIDGGPYGEHWEKIARAWENSADLWARTTKMWERNVDVWRRFITLSWAYSQEKYALALEEEIGALIKLKSTKLFVGRAHTIHSEAKRKVALWASLSEAWKQAAMDAEYALILEIQYGIGVGEI